MATYQFDDDKRRACIQRNDRTSTANHPIRSNPHTKHAEQLARDKKIMA